MGMSSLLQHRHCSANNQHMHLCMPGRQPPPSPPPASHLSCVGRWTEPPTPTPIPQSLRFVYICYIRNPMTMFVQLLQSINPSPSPPASQDRCCVVRWTEPPTPTPTPTPIPNPSPSHPPSLSPVLCWQVRTREVVRAKPPPFSSRSAEWGRSGMSSHAMAGLWARALVVVAPGDTGGCVRSDTKRVGGASGYCMPCIH